MCGMTGQFPVVLVLSCFFVSNADACFVFVGCMLACAGLAGRCGFDGTGDFAVHVGQRRHCTASIVGRG